MAIVSGILAGSVALMAFGIDSGIEVVSATIVMIRLRALIGGGEPDEAKERTALKAVVVFFYALAVYVIVDAAISLARADHPSSSPSGLAITAAALVVMPVLAMKKRRAASSLVAAGHHGPATLLRADAAETLLYAVLSVTTLVGVSLDSAFGWWWADPVASLAVIYFAIKEGREAWQGELCCDD